MGSVHQLESGSYFDPNISPDGRQVALSIQVGPNQDIWVHDIARGTWTRLSQDAAADMAPVWPPARRLIVVQDWTQELKRLVPEL